MPAQVAHSFEGSLILFRLSVVCSTFILLASGATSASYSTSSLILQGVSLGLASEALFSLNNSNLQAFSKVSVWLEMTKDKESQGHLAPNLLSTAY